MGRYIIQIEGYYLEWSTIVDAPVTFGMTLEEFEKYYLEEYGRNGYRDFEKRMSRVRDKGTSSYLSSLLDLESNNRAGPDETKLILVEIYQAYCKRLPIQNGWVVPICGDTEEEK